MAKGEGVESMGENRAEAHAKWVHSIMDRVTDGWKLFFRGSEIVDATDTGIRAGTVWIPWPKVDRRDIKIKPPKTKAVEGGRAKKVA